MTISETNSNKASLVPFDPWEPAVPVNNGLKRKVPEEYENNSIKKAKNAEDAWACLYPEVVGTFLPQQHKASFDPTVSRPKLETPTVDTAKLSAASEEIKELVGQVEGKEQEGAAFQDAVVDKNLAEIALLQAFIQCMKMQRSQNETNAELTLDTVQKNQSANQKIKEEYFNKLDEHIAKNKKSGVLSWINWVLYGALAVVGVASLALTITASVATAGAALPLGLTVTMSLVNGVLSIGSGGTSIYKGVLDYQNKKLIGTLEEKKWERQMQNDRIKSGMDEMRQSMEVVSANWKELILVVNNWKSTAIGK